MNAGIINYKETNSKDLYSINSSKEDFVQIKITTLCLLHIFLRLKRACLRSGEQVAMINTNEAKKRKIYLLRRGME